MNARTSDRILKGPRRAGGIPSVMKELAAVALIHPETETVAGGTLGELLEGEVIVIRYEGPKGGPGMREMLLAT